VPTCEPIVKYSSSSFSVKGIEIPLTDSPLKIGEVVWEPKILQQASVIVQILDNHRLATCQSLPAYASSGRDQFAKRLAEMQDDETRITQLALLLAANYPEAVNKYIEAYSSRAVLLSAQATASPSLTAKIPKNLFTRMSKVLDSKASTNAAALLPTESFLK